MVGWGYQGPLMNCRPGIAHAAIRHGITPAGPIRCTMWSRGKKSRPPRAQASCTSRRAVAAKTSSLAKTELRILAPIDENGVYYDGYAWLRGQYVGGVAPRDGQSEKEGLSLPDRIDPACLSALLALWHRTGFPQRRGMVHLDGAQGRGEVRHGREGLRFEIMEVVRHIRWIPDFGLERELDWLRNMEDWMISKKRYWGLALPIYRCASAAISRSSAARTNCTSAPSRAGTNSTATRRTGPMWMR